MVEEIARKYIHDLAEFIENLYRSELKSKVRSDSELLKFSTNVIIQGDYFSITFNVTDYWKYFEYGRRPGGMPPTKAIEDWIKIKKLIPKAYNGKIPSTKQLAYVIARSIGKNGIQGKYVFDKVINDPSIDNFLDDIKKKITDEVKSEIFINFVEKLRNQIK